MSPPRVELTPEAFEEPQRELEIVTLKGTFATLDGDVAFDFAMCGVDTIARDFVQVLRVKAAALRPLTAYQYAGRCRQFLSWLADQEGVTRATATADIPPEVLTEYERQLRGRMQDVSASQRTAKVLDALTAIHTEGIQELPEALLVEASGLNDEYGTFTPREAYGPQELKRIRKALRHRMVLALKTRRAGQQLHEQWEREGRPGQCGPYSTPGHVLTRLKTEGWMKQPESRYAPPKKRTGKRADWPYYPTLLNYVFPTLDDLAPYFLQVILTTGIEVLALADLTTDQVELGRTKDGKRSVTITYTKYRADKKQTLHFTGDSRLQPPRLFETVLELTEPVREVAPLDLKKRLWLSVSYKTGVSATLHLGQLVPRFAREHLTAEDGTVIDLAAGRLRKNYWVRAYRSAGGDIRTATRGRKTLSVASEHYFRGEALADDHEEAVAAGLHAALNVKPRIVADDSDIEGEDSWLATCTDSQHSPWQNSSGSCSDPVLGCLFCPNAVFAPHKLPALMHLLNFMQHQRELLAPEVWIERWGTPCDMLIQGILPKFEQHEVLAARSQAENGQKLLFLPISVLNIKP